LELECVREKAIQILIQISKNNLMNFKFRERVNKMPGEAGDLP
jgi:hypothetical protein